MKKGIDLYLISGFLGSGKTTFLQKLLNNMEDIRVGVIVNEFGGIGIDGARIEKDGISLVEINNGSIFCSCLKGDFVKTLIEFSTMEIDVLVIENSGMADPSNIHQLIEEINHRVSRTFDYRGAVCIVDSVSFLKQVQVLAPVQNQIASSNFIIINKVDLVNQSTINAIRKKILELNSQAFVCETMYSEIPILLLKEKLYDNGYTGETSNRCYNRPASYSLEGEGCYTVEDMRCFIEKLKPYILRMKGWLKGENDWWQVDVVDEQIEILPKQLGKRDIIDKTKLVIIGHEEKDFQQEIDTAWKEVFHDTPVIYQ